MRNEYHVIDGQLAVTSTESKTLADVERVIALGKSDAVVERFAALYLASLDPHQQAKDDWYQAHARILELEAIPVDVTEQRTVVAEDGSESTETVTTYSGQDLTEAEMAELDRLTAERDALELGTVIPATADEEGNELTPESRADDGRLWLQTLRGEGSEPVPEFTPEPVAEFLSREFPQRAKAKRNAAVEAILVTTGSGKVFDGDETSQTRMARAVAAGNPGDTTHWKLADDSIQAVSWEELKEALLLSGQAQTSIWVDHG
jgi:hypothetical protein